MAIPQEIIDTVLRLAKENPYWGFGRIRNYMIYLGYSVGRSTVKGSSRTMASAPSQREPR